MWAPQQNANKHVLYSTSYRRVALGRHGYSTRRRQATALGRAAAIAVSAILAVSPNSARRANRPEFGPDFFGRILEIRRKKRTSFEAIA